ncbi:MAG: Fic family protein [Hyphomicrobiaceae bacterium]
MALATELYVAAAQLKGRMPPGLARELASVVRSTNCYYSNLIEGHNTHPWDIERALRGDYDALPAQRNLQLEALAHIEVQKLIDEGAAPSPVVSEEFICWLHREFCKRLPAGLLTVDGGVAVTPGAYRTQHVSVGRHVAPAPNQIPSLLSHFVSAYGGSREASPWLLVEIASAHHRLLWIHPFLDGNGRVARLFSHAMLREYAIGTDLWSISRGLARHAIKYKQELASADEARQGDLDGRGNLSERALTEFCEFFLKTCLDQVSFMGKMLDPSEILGRVTAWSNEEVAANRLPRGSTQLLRQALLEGEIARGAVAEITGYRERQGRTVLAALLQRGVLKSDSPKGAVRLAFPSWVLERWLPALYPN